MCCAALRCTAPMSAAAKHSGPACLMRWCGGAGFDLLFCDVDIPWATDISVPMAAHTDLDWVAQVPCAPHTSRASSLDYDRRGIAVVVPVWLLWSRYHDLCGDACARDAAQLAAERRQCWIVLGAEVRGMFSVWEDKHTTPGV